jgi:pilus assembly protein CpaC
MFHNLHLFAGILSLVLCISCVRPCTAADEMVEIAVEVTEVNTTKARQLGIQWCDTIQAGEVAWTQTGRLPASLPEVPSLIQTGDWARYTSLSADLKLLEAKGAAQVLSKPRILTRSGTSAKVIVGGEIPIVSSGVSGGTIQWKEFGIKTEILPRVLSDGIVDLTLTTEVSRLDWSNQVSGNPAVMKREANSSIRMKSGQTLTLAGLLETKKDEQTTGIPLLCDIPVLGALFSRKTMNETRTNVLIFVTPRIVVQ